MKRLIGVVTVKNNLAVQSFGYKKYLPLGKPEILIKNLDRWGADEILVNVIDRSYNNSGPDFNLIEKIKEIKISTPLIYGGGIRSFEDANKVIKEGADRILIESIFNDRVNEVKMISNYIGSQSIILSLPLTIDNNMLHRFDYRNNKKFFFKNFFIDSTKLVSEILIIDYKNEGYQNKFNEKIIEKFPNLKIPIIAYGGVFGKKKIKNLLNNKKINAIAIGNILNYTENSIKKIKLANKNYLRL
jgi:cyclase